MDVYLGKLLILASILFINCDPAADPMVCFSWYSAVNNRSERVKYRYYNMRIPYYSNSVCTFQLLKSGDIESNPGPTHHSDEDTNNHNLKCVLFNARNVANKILELQTELALNHIDIVCVSETWLCPDITDGEILDTSLSNIPKWPKS